MKFDTPATTNPIDQLKIVGKPTNRIDGPLKTTGTAPYAYEQHAVAPNAAYGHVIGAGIAGASLAHFLAPHARVALLEGSRLRPGERMFAQLLINAPVHAVKGDRLILRDQSAQRTLGGGQVLDPLSSGTVFSTPPVQQTLATANIDQLAASIFATNATFTESSMSFMTPPNPTDLAKLKGRGAKVMVFHGTGDAVFSYDDTVNWYKGVAAANQGDASNFARLFPVPAMGHCGSGITTDQFDMLTPLVNWVEKGQAPDKVIAQARGAGNAAGANLELPASWSANRTRPLCAYPKVARYNGTGDIESASSFSCK